MTKYNPFRNEADPRDHKMTLFSRHFGKASPHRKRNWLLALLGLAVLLVLIVVPAAVVSSKRKPGKGHSEKEPIDVPDSSKNAGPVVGPSFLSYSIEFASLPDYAGTRRKPNQFSRNLLDNIAAVQGSRSHIRVGGNTQDFAVVERSLDTPTNASFVSWKAPGVPTMLHIGPSYFGAYDAFADGTKFIHGFNLARNGSTGRKKLLESASLACKALSGGKLLSWEFGNEPDLYKRDGQDREAARPDWWTEQDYVAELKDESREVRRQISKSCPGMEDSSEFRMMSPSFSAPWGPMNLVDTWKKGLRSVSQVAEVSVHNYVDSGNAPGATLKDSLLSHKKTVSTLDPHLRAKSQLDSDIPYVLGETNSIYNARSDSGPFADSFGAALWHLDFGLLAAASGIGRIHLHQGTNFPYGSWQPVDTESARRIARPAYYGNIATAAALGKWSTTGAGEGQPGRTRVESVPLESDEEAVYTTFSDDRLAKLVVINMEVRNSTSSGQGRKREYHFQLPNECRNSSATLRRLLGPGSDATTGVTFAGHSFAFELDEGRPARMKNVSESEEAKVNDKGRLVLKLPLSSAALVELDCSAG